MNMLVSDLNKFAEELIPQISDSEKWCQTVICCPFVLIAPSLKAFASSIVKVGAQNVSQYDSGAYTGEVSVAQLCDIGAEYVIIGHSERRELYGESDKSVNEKLIKSLSSAITPIVCVGEKLEQREAGVTHDLVSLQVKTALQNVSAEDVRRVVFAYEPVWAIGTGKTASAEDAQDVCKLIRTVLSDIYDKDIADSITIQYGGSMNEKNAKQLLGMPDIDGGLIGGASLKPETFSLIVSSAKD